MENPSKIEFLFLKLKTLNCSKYEEKSLKVRN